MSNTESKAFGDLKRVFGVRLRKKHDELLTAVSSHDIVDSKRLAATVGDLYEDVVPGRMTEAVIDSLEMINIDHDCGQRRMVTPSTLHLRRNKFEDVTPIGDAGQCVRARSLLYGRKKAACSALKVASLVRCTESSPITVPRNVNGTPIHALTSSSAKRET